MPVTVRWFWTDFCFCAVQKTCPLCSKLCYFCKTIVHVIKSTMLMVKCVMN